MSTEDEGVRAFANALFGRPDDPVDAPPDDKPGNYVASEGNNPNPVPVNDLRHFAAALFGEQY